MITDKAKIIADLQYRLQAMGQEIKDTAKRLDLLHYQVLEIATDIETILTFLEGDDLP